MIFNELTDKHYMKTLIQYCPKCNYLWLFNLQTGRVFTDYSEYDVNGTWNCWKNNHSENWIHIGEFKEEQL